MGAHTPGPDRLIAVAPRMLALLKKLDEVQAARDPWDAPLFYMAEQARAILHDVGEGAMGAKCDRCGYDLPFMADCSYCEVVRQRDALLEALERLVKHNDALCKSSGLFSTADSMGYPHNEKARAAIAQAKGGK